MENEEMITVLNEVLSEQKEASQKMDELTRLVGSLSDLNNKFANNFGNFKTDLVPENLRSTEALINRNADEIKSLITEQPKEIVHQRRYLFFPENNVRDYYDVCMKWLIRIVISGFD